MILYLAPEAPVPPLSGGRERAQQLLAALTQRAPLHLLSCASAEEAPQLVSLARGLGLAGLTVQPYPADARGHHLKLAPAAGGLLGQEAAEQRHHQAGDQDDGHLPEDLLGPHRGRRRGVVAVQHAQQAVVLQRYQREPLPQGGRVGRPEELHDEGDHGGGRRASVSAHGPTIGCTAGGGRNRTRCSEG